MQRRAIRNFDRRQGPGEEWSGFVCSPLALGRKLWIWFLAKLHSSAMASVRCLQVASVPPLIENGFRPSTYSYSTTGCFSDCILILKRACTTFTSRTYSAGKLLRVRLVSSSLLPPDQTFFHATLPLTFAIFTLETSTGKRCVYSCCVDSMILPSDCMLVRPVTTATFQVHDRQHSHYAHASLLAIRWSSSRKVYIAYGYSTVIVSEVGGSRLLYG